MNGVAIPIKTFAVAIWRIKDCLELLDTFGRTIQPKYPFNIESCDPEIGNQPGNSDMV